MHRLSITPRRKKKRDAPYLRIARGGVGKVPLSSLQDASRCCVCIAIPNWSRRNHHTAHPITYYFCASYTFWVSDALGYARNNSECFISPDFSPNRLQKYKKLCETRKYLRNNLLFSEFCRDSTKKNALFFVFAAPKFANISNYAYRL